MKKRRRLMILLFGMIVLSIIYYFLFYEVPGVADEQDLQQEDFLSDKKGIIYFSTTADQDMDGGGKSFAIFIDKKGATRTFEMDGLELGGIGVGEKQILMEDKEYFYKISEGFQKIKRDGYQHTGDQIGYQSEREGFYALFNSGFDKETGNYRSDYYWEEDGEFQKGMIPFFVEASVMSDDSLYTLSTSEDEKNYRVSKVALERESIPQTLGEIEKKENSTTFGQLQADESYLYFIMQTGNLTEMVKVERQTGRHSKYKVTEYPNDEQTLYEQTPFSFKRSVLLHENHLYFIDGFGTVLQIDKHTGESKEAFILPASSLKGSAELFQREENLYLFSLNHEKNTAKIEHFSLSGGKKKGELEIKEFPELNTFIKRVHLYDFVMLDDFH